MASTIFKSFFRRTRTRTRATSELACAARDSALPYPTATILNKQEHNALLLTGRTLPAFMSQHTLLPLPAQSSPFQGIGLSLPTASVFFRYLDGYFIARRSIPAINEVVLTSFRDLIDKQHGGGEIDRALLKNVIEMITKIGMGQMDAFEVPMLDDSGACYSRKASNWILKVSWLDYMLKAEECYKKDVDRVSDYLHSSKEPKLVEGDGGEANGGGDASADVYFVCIRCGETYTDKDMMKTHQCDNNWETYCGRCYNRFQNSDIRNQHQEKCDWHGYHEKFGGKPIPFKLIKKNPYLDKWVHEKKEE